MCLSVCLLALKTGYLLSQSSILPDSREVLLFIGDLDQKDIGHLEQSVLELIEKNEDGTQNRQYQMIYDTHKCQGEDG